MVITMKSQDPKSLLEDPVVTPPSPMMDIALRTGLQLVFSLLLKVGSPTFPTGIWHLCLHCVLQLWFYQILNTVCMPSQEDNARIRMQMLNTAFTALRSLAPLSFFREASGIKVVPRSLQPGPVCDSLIHCWPDGV